MNLHDAIMNLRADVPGDCDEKSYRIGHRDARHAAAELVAALPVSPSAQEWRSIASAPKGTQILVWIVGIEPRPRIAYWSDRASHGGGVGWFGLQSQHFIGLNVTHWMPLPAAPVREE